MIVNNQIEKIRQDLDCLSKKSKDKKEQVFVQHYLGTQKKCLCVKTGDVLKIAKVIAKNQNNIPAKDMTDLLDRLFSGATIEEHIIAGKIFTLLTPEHRSKISFSQLKKWLQKTHGWVEIDVICQSSYSAAEVLARWNDWEEAIRDFSDDKNIQVRRASLVLQCLSARKTDARKVRALAFEIIDKLKSEKEVLITKAVSWLLRSLIFYGKAEVKKYVAENESLLPRIAYRETIKKIETGKSQ